MADFYAVRNKKNGLYAGGSWYGTRENWKERKEARLFSKTGHIKQSPRMPKGYKLLGGMKVFDPNIEIVEFELKEVASYPISKIYKKK